MNKLAYLQNELARLQKEVSELMESCELHPCLTVNLHGISIRFIQLPDGAYMAEIPCTQELWTAVMGNNPSSHQGDPELPVEQVSYEDVQGFLAKLREEHPEYEFGLPTAQEWEMAVKAGAEEIPTPEPGKANFWHEGSPKKTTPVRTYPPNAWGFYDLQGNVWEWCDEN